MQRLFLPIAAVVVSLIFACTNAGNKINVEDAVISETVDSVLIAFNEKIIKDPGNPLNYYNRAKYLFETKKDFDGAVADMDRVFLLDSSKVEYFITLSDMYYTKGVVSKVQDLLERGININPESIDARMKLAELHLYLKEYKDCLNNLDKVLKTDKYNAKAYFIKGMAFKEIGDTAKAVSSFQTTIEQDPEYFHAYIHLGLLFSIRKNKVALDYLNSAIKINPQSIEAWYAAGKFCQDNGMLDKAKEAYFNIIDINPEYEFAHYNLGYIHSELLGDFKTAVEHYSNAVMHAPDYIEAHYMRGYAFERLKDKKNAEENYRKALDLDPTYTLAALGLGRIIG
jgi:tetratricopeptide (TPR) repeat protein